LVNLPLLSLFLLTCFCRYQIEGKLTELFPKFDFTKCESIYGDGMGCGNIEQDEIVAEGSTLAEPKEELELFERNI
jgi:hypothetical protein